MDVCGRKLKIVTGTKSQTVNICTSDNLLGLYDYRVRLGPTFISAETLAATKFDTIDDLVRFLERNYDGQIEQRPVVQSADASLLNSFSGPAFDRQSVPKSEFHAWRNSWDLLGNHGGIAEVIELWHAPVPDPWMRAENDTPARLLTSNRYTRGNRSGHRRGEHVIEYEILVQRFRSVTCLNASLLDGVNAFPLVKDNGGDRICDVEADLVLLAGEPGAALIWVCDVKITDGNPWKALLQNLRQLRLFTLNATCASFFGLRGSTEKVSQICGAVIAPELFYFNSGKREDSLRRAESLSEAISKPPHNVRAELLVWDAVAARLFRHNRMRSDRFDSTRMMREHC
jgi:hypothetical protein